MLHHNALVAQQLVTEDLAPRTTVSSATPNTTTNTQLVVSLGTPADGDVVVVEISGLAAGTVVDPVMATPTGWTKRGEQLENAGTPASWAGVYWRRWLASDPAFGGAPTPTTVTFTWTNPGQMIAHATPWAGAHPTDPLGDLVMAPKPGVGDTSSTLR